MKPLRGKRVGSAQSARGIQLGGLGTVARCGRIDPLSVARVQPRTSKGITDLLLLNLVWLNATCPSKKLDADRTGPRN